MEKDELKAALQRAEAERDRLNERRKELTQEIQHLKRRVASKRKQFTPVEKKTRAVKVLNYRAEGLTFKEIGERLGVSHSRASQIHNWGARVYIYGRSKGAMPDEYKHLSPLAIEELEDYYEAFIARQ